MANSRHYLQIIVETIKKGSGAQQSQREVEQLGKKIDRFATQADRAGIRTAALEQKQISLAKQVSRGKISVDQAAESLAKFRNNLPVDEMDEAGNSAGGFLGKIGGSGLLTIGAFTGAVTAAGVAAKKAFDFAQAGAQLNQLEQSFESVNERIFKTPKLLEDMRKAARGTVSDAQIMQGVLTLTAGASNELAQQLAQNSPQLIEIAKAANKVNPLLGDTAFLYESIALGVKRGSPLILDNLGIMVKVGEANRKYAESLGKTVAELTVQEKQMALLNETLRAGDQLIEQAGGNVDNLADSYAQAEVEYANFIDGLKKGFAEFVGQRIVGGRAVDRLNKAIKEEIITTSEQVEMRQRLTKAGLTNAEATIRIVDAIGLLEEGYVDSVEAGLKLLANEEEYQAALAERARQERELAEAQIKEAKRQIGAADQVLKNYFEEEKAVIDLTKQWEEYAKIQEENREKTDKFIKTRRALAEQLEREPELFDKINREIGAAAAGTDPVGDRFQGPTIGPWFKALYDMQAFAEASTSELSFLNEELDDLGPKFVTWGGRTSDQNRLLDTMTDEVDRLNRQIADAQAAPEMFGGADEANKRMESATERINELAPAIERLNSIQGEAGLANVEFSVNQEALTSAFYEQTNALLGNEEALREYGVSAEDSIDKAIALGIATGELNEEQAAAILKQLELQKGIDALSEAYGRNIVSADQAAQALNILGSEGLGAMQEYIAGIAGTLTPLNEAISNLDRDLPKIEVEADIVPALTELNNLKGELTTLKASVLFDTLDPQAQADVERQIQEVEGAMALAIALEVEGADTTLTNFEGDVSEFVDDEHIATIEAETTEALLEVENLVAEADAATEEPYVAEFKADTNQAERDISRLESAADSAAGTRKLIFKIETQGTIPGDSGGQTRHTGGPIVPGTLYRVQKDEFFMSPIAGNITKTAPTGTTGNGGHGTAEGVQVKEGDTYNNFYPQTEAAMALALAQVHNNKRRRMNRTMGG